MDATVLEKMDELIAQQKRLNDLLESLLQNSDAARRQMGVVENSCTGLELVAGEALSMKESMSESEVLWQVLATSIGEAQLNALGDTTAKAVEAANAFKAGLAAFNAATKAVSE